VKTRRDLPSNVLGLLFHAAEHTQRHTGQVITTSKIIVPTALLGGVSLLAWPSGALTDIRSGRGPRALVTLHSAVCPGCQRYICGLLASSAGRISEWGGRLNVVVPGHGENAHELAKAMGGAVPILLDPEGKLASGKAMVIVTDEWGEVYFVSDADAGHDLPVPVQIAEWIRFLAIQCPECEGPEGEWRTI
jgi:hypothetical protein